MSATILGMLRVKNEARWIERVIRAMQPACASILVFDDHSSDDTPDICEELGAVVFRSAFTELDERADKDFLLQRVYESIPEHDQHYTQGNATSPYWALCLDGDEELTAGSGELLRQAAESDRADSYSVRVLYAWNSVDQVRVDGVYSDFRRPSLFRLMNQGFRFQSTPWGGNLHCSSIPQELIGGSKPCDAAVLHFGYVDEELRRRKYEWYTKVDPNNPMEDFYRHLTQGDPGGWPARARLKWAGPLQLEPLASFQH